jgi:hypothetical protein
MSLRSSTENANGERRHAGMDGRHPGTQDASGDIHVVLDSSTPCWNDGIEPFTWVFSREESKHMKDSFHIFELRALRDLRGNISLAIN